MCVNWPTVTCRPRMTADASGAPALHDGSPTCVANPPDPPCNHVTENGRQMTDAELGQTLEEAWRTIASDGWNKVEPGQYQGAGQLANAGSQARVIHFATPEAYVSYLGKYGHGNVFGALSSHIDWMARNIGLTETFGPNPKALFDSMHDTAMQSAGVDKVGLLMNTTDMYKTLAGEFNNPESQRAARIGQGLRNIEVAGKLQQTLLSSVTDIPSYYATLGYNRLPFWQGTVNLVRSMGSETREYANRAGLISDSIVSDMAQYGEGNMGQGWTARLANATTKAGLLNAFTDAVRRAFSVTMMGGMAKIAHTPWEQLEAGDRARLTTKGWTADEWAVLQKATPEQWRGVDMLTPQSVMGAAGVDTLTKQRVVSRLLGTIADESEYASIAPDLTTRTLQAGGLQRGTGKGELWRSLFLFKSFPIAVMTCALGTGPALGHAACWPAAVRRNAGCRSDDVRRSWRDPVEGAGGQARPARQDRPRTARIQRAALKFWGASILARWWRWLPGRHAVVGHGQAGPERRQRGTGGYCWPGGGQRLRAGL